MLYISNFDHKSSHTWVPFPAPGGPKNMPRAPWSHDADDRPLFLIKSSTIGALLLPLPGSNLTKSLPNQPFFSPIVAAMFKETAVCPAECLRSDVRKPTMCVKVHLDTERCARARRPPILRKFAKKGRIADRIKL